MKAYSLAQYEAVDCMQFEPGLFMAIVIHRATGGRMCDGCPKMGQSCYQRLTAPEAIQRRIAADNLRTETVRQEAERLGVTIAEVRRRRADATAPKA